MINARQQRRLIGSGAVNAFLHFTATRLFMRRYARRENKNEREGGGGGRREKRCMAYLRACLRARERTCFVRRNVDVKVNGNASVRTIMACKKVVEGHRGISRFLFDTVCGI